ncbi:carbohydrate ABC transporter permease [Actinomyces qiguomingii]|uniref:carbohydrate ABC transporter permease n=1 Tax=Actinomyces qiguomingii TaxID=2057800 RepID=UPI000CA07CD4|nr:sugar ABC transporter permease [Actinomyces qiguomingii]
MSRLSISGRGGGPFRPRGRRAAENLAGSAFLMPIIAVFIILFAVPLAQTFYFSLTNFSGYSTDVEFVGLKNYATVFSDPSLLQGLIFTIMFALATTVLITVVAIPLAVVLNKRFLGRNLVRSLFFFLSVPSMAILGLVWQYILSPLDNGVVNSLLHSLFGAEAVAWLAQSTSARVCVILVAVWAGVGWHATLYLAYLQAIPADLYEQAELDGAGQLQQFRHITLPQLAPGIVVSTFLLMSGGLKVYDLPFTLTKGGPGFATNTLTQSIIVQGIAQGRADVGSALAVIFTAAVALIVLAQLVVSNRIERSLS